MKHSQLGLVTLAALMLFGCSDDSSTTLNVASFNVGMARAYVDYAAERFDPIIEAVKGMDETDVLCVQELWADEDIDALTKAVATTFPHSYYHRTRLSDFASDSTEPPACTMEETKPLVDCSVPLCDDAMDLATCVLGSCQDEFNAMSTDCQSCAAANIGLGEVDAILAACTTAGGAQYTYDGHNGLMILSKVPLEATEYVNLDSFLTVRTVLTARAQGLGMACTHLTATLSDPPYNGEYDSYGAENAAQVDTVLKLLAERFGAGPAILAGDLNAGPEVSTSLKGALPDNYARIEADGWTSASLASGSPDCTWCADNPLTGASSDVILDHIMVKGATSSNYTRLFDGRIDVQTADGGTQSVCLSDHYGLRATIDW